MIRPADVAIVGAGIAGASLAAEISASRSVLLLEAESVAGYHSTGRSAAFWSETYGGPIIRPLTVASHAFLARPPADFSDRSFLSARGAVHLARSGGEASLDALEEAFAGSGLTLERLDREALERMIPGLRPPYRTALSEPSCADIDVGGLHSAYLRRARAQGAVLATNARVERAERINGAWRLSTRDAAFEAGILVNAAGAWADGLAEAAGERPLGIRPFRRTISQLRVTPGVPADLPLVIDAEGQYYFKPESGGRLWLSPHDETPCDPCDSAPEAEDVAIAIDRLEQAVDWTVERVERSWSGLRSFAPDRLPVIGFTESDRDFFWFAGQGGFGIQTAPAAAKLAAALILDRPPDPEIAGIEPSLYSAARFRN